MHRVLSACRLYRPVAPEAVPPGGDLSLYLSYLPGVPDLERAATDLHPHAGRHLYVCACRRGAFGRGGGGGGVYSPLTIALLLLIGMGGMVCVLLLTIAGRLARVLHLVERLAAWTGEDTP